MNINKLTLASPDYPPMLREIKTRPDQLYYSGPLLELLRQHRVAIVGSRRITSYGHQITTIFAKELARRGIVIISGLAIGVDATAHRACLEAGGKTIAVLPSPLDNILPSMHRRLAERILENGGALVSEYEAGLEPNKHNFIERNRIMSGLAEAVLLTEAAENSGTVHTAQFAADQGRDVLVVPGNITSLTSVGTNHLLKTGAAPATSYLDVLHALKLEDNLAPARAPEGRNVSEQSIIDLLASGVIEGEQLLELSGLDVAVFGQVLTMLELRGAIRPLGANRWILA